MSERILTESQLYKYLSVLQQNCKMQDWTISIIVNDTSNPNIYANVSWDLNILRANIKFTDPKYFVDCNPIDMLFTLCHEFAHLLISYLDIMIKNTNELKDILIEQCVNKIALGLLIMLENSDIGEL